GEHTRRRPDHQPCQPRRRLCSAYPVQDYPARYKDTQVPRHQALFPSSPRTPSIQPTHYHSNHHNGQPHDPRARQRRRPGPRAVRARQRGPVALAPPARHQRLHRAVDVLLC
ncbi:uncharacterized protein K452DRAFT_319647, partial [Aplosporella prunicola CBS 121167]